MSGPATLIILGEDGPHIQCVYNAVTKHLGIASGRVIKLPAPVGKGDATKFVLDKLEKEATALRSAPRSVRLIVCLDADNNTVIERRRHIDRHVAKAELDDQRRSQSIVCVVPKRNIETWLGFGRCESVDETTNYKDGRQSRWNSEDHKLVGALLGMVPIPKENPPASLSDARSELLEKVRSD